MEEKGEGKRRATETGESAAQGSPAKIPKKDEATWCAECWSRPTATCDESKGHRLVDATEAHAEVSSELSEMLSELERMKAKIKKHHDRLNAVEEVLEDGRRLVLMIDADPCDGYGPSIEGGTFNMILAVDSLCHGDEEVKELCVALEGVDFNHYDKVGTIRPATFSAKMPKNLFNKLPKAHADLEVKEGAVLVTAPGSPGVLHIFRIYTESVNPLIEGETRVLGRVTENLEAVAIEVEDHCDCGGETEEMGGGLLTNVRILEVLSSDSESNSEAS